MFTGQLINSLKYKCWCCSVCVLTLTMNLKKQMEFSSPHTPFYTLYPLSSHANLTTSFFLNLSHLLPLSNYLCFLDALYLSSVFISQLYLSFSLSFSFFLFLISFPAISAVSLSRPPFILPFLILTNATFYNVISPFL